MSDQHYRLRPVVLQLIRRLHDDALFLQAAKESPEQTLAGFALDAIERQAIERLLKGWDNLPQPPSDAVRYTSRLGNK